MSEHVLVFLFLVICSQLILPGCSFYRMRYVAAYLLAALAGNANPEAKDIKKILESVGIEADDTRLDKVQSSLLFIVFLVLWQQLSHQRLVIAFVIFTNLISLNRSSLSSMARMWMRSSLQVRVPTCHLVFVLCVLVNLDV